MSQDQERIVLGDIKCDFLQRNKLHDLKFTLRMDWLKQTVQNAIRCTKGTSALIDNIATTHENNVAKNFTEACSISDHDLTGVIVNKNCQNSNRERFSPVIVKNIMKITSRNISRVSHGNRFFMQKAISILPGKIRLKSLLLLRTRENHPTSRKSANGIAASNPLRKISRLN